MLFAVLCVAVVGATAVVAQGICPPGTEPACYCPGDIMPSAAPTASPSASPTAVAPTASPTASPSASPTAVPPTASPTASPSASPTVAPSAAPTAAPVPCGERICLFGSCSGCEQRECLQFGFFRQCGNIFGILCDTDADCCVCDNCSGTANPACVDPAFSAAPTVSPTVSPTPAPTPECGSCPLPAEFAGVPSCGTQAATCSCVPAASTASAGVVVNNGTLAAASAECALGDNDRFAFALAATGDVDGDGVPDVLVGVPDRDGTTTTQRGTLMLVTLDTAAGVLTCQDLIEDMGARRKRAPVAVTGLGDGDGIGSAVAFTAVPSATVGVFNTVAGAPFDDDGPALDSGALYGFAVAHASGITAQAKVSNTEGSLPFALAANDEWGGAVAFAGDIDGDGVGDLLVGQRTAASSAGRVDVLFMNADFTVSSAAPAIDSSQLDAPLAAGDEFGAAVAWLGDIGADGMYEYAIGAPGANGLAGAFYIVSLNATGAVVAQERVLASDGRFSGAANQPMGLLGMAVATAGDANCDGHADLLVTAPGNSSDTAVRSRIYRALLTSGGPPFVTSIEVIASGVLAPPGDGFGYSVATLGDLSNTGRGTAEIVIGAPFTDSPSITGIQETGSLAVLFYDPLVPADNVTLCARTDTGSVTPLVPAAGASLCTVDGDCDECMCASGTNAALCGAPTASPTASP